LHRASAPCEQLAGLGVDDLVLLFDPQRVLRHVFTLLWLQLSKDEPLAI
jgi:hypothetical protein